MSRWRRSLVIALLALSVTLVGSPLPMAKAQVLAPSQDVRDGICFAVDAGALTLGSEALSALTRGKIGEGLLATVLVEIIETNCEASLEFAISQINGLFGSAPDAARVSSVNTFLDELPVSSPSSIASQLAPTHDVSGPDIKALVRDICADFAGTRSSNAVTDLATALPNLSLADSWAVNAISRLAIKRCRLNSFEADALAWAFTHHVVERALTRDVVAPWVSVSGTIDGATVSISWFGFDASGIASYEVLGSPNGSWIRLAADPLDTSLTLRYPTGLGPYHVAVRATDRAGNASAWSYLFVCDRC